MGETDCGENWVLFWWGGAMLSKSLIRFSADVWGCVPSLLFDLRPKYGGGNGDNGASFKRSQVRTATLSAPMLQQATPDLHLCRRFLDTHGQVWVSLLWGHCSFLLGPGAHKVLFVPSKSLFPQSCGSSGGSMVRLMVTSSKRAYAAPRAPAPAAVHCWPVPAFQNTERQVQLGLCVVSWCTQGFVWALQASLVVWGLILYMILPVLPSCWGFSFALGHGVSFLGGTQHCPVNGCSAVCCNFWVLAGEDEHTSFYSAILCRLYFCNSGVCLSSQAAIMHSTILFWKFLYPGFKLPIFNAQTSSSHASTVHVPWASRCSRWI